MKNPAKIWAIVFGFISFGAILETRRIFSSNAPDIAENREALAPMAIGLTAIFLGLTFYFWNKSRKEKPSV